jgi:hypothetical protein
MRSAMRTLTLISIISLSACGPQEATIDDQGDELGISQGKIVGGADVTIAAYPYQVALMDSSYFQFCGGTIVGASWVLTANHCVDGMAASSLRIGAGSSKISGLASGQVRSVSQIIRYPGYSSPEYGHDAALLRLSTPLDLSGPTAKAIGLVSAADANGGATATGVAATVSGWGTTSSNAQNTVDTLRAVTVNIVSQSTLQQEYGSITADQIGAAAAGKDSCQGDSGGPLVVSVGGERKLAGIVSYGNGCALAGYAGIYGRVSSFESWVQQNIGGATGSTTSPPPATESALLDQSNLSAAKGTWTRFTVTVPAGAPSLTIVTQGGSGDADLYVRFGASPTTSAYNCRPYTNGNNETCSFANPPAGTWSIGIRGYASFSGLSVRATLP